MAPSSFYITFRKMYDPRTYRARVDMIQKTERFIRFRITAGKREITMEKLLFRKGNQWQVIDFNFQFQDSIANDKLMLDIQREIDKELSR